MSSYSIPPLGDIFASNVEEAEKTLEVIRRFLSHRHKDSELRMDLNNKIRKLEN